MTTLAVRPPEYWPGLSFFALMSRVDRFVLADTFQYSRQSFQNRSRLRTPQGWQWISVPLRGGQHGTPIDRARIRPTPYWMRSHWRALVHNYSSTPFFPFYEADIKPLFFEEWTHLGALTCTTVEVLHRLLRPRCEVVRASALPGRPDALPDVLAAVGEGMLVAPPAAASYDAAHAPDLRVLRYDAPTYAQNFDGFEPGMSVLDLLFNYGPEAPGILHAAGILSDGSGILGEES